MLYCRMTTHGRYGTPEYKAWDSAKQHCDNPNSPGYEYYGGRGITMCNEWYFDFGAFFQYMGKKPTPEHSLGRIDNDGNYEPGNCEWQTMKQQGQNRRNTKLTSDDIDGIRKLDAKGLAQRQIAEEYNICQSYVSDIVNYRRRKEG